MRIRSHALVTAALALAAAWPAEAKQPNPASDALRMVPDESESFSRTPLGRVSNETGFPLALYRVNHAVEMSYAPDVMARQYLREAAAQLGLAKADLSDLRHRATHEGPGSITVRFDQTYQGLPVYQGEVTVSLDQHATVTFVMNGYKHGVRCPTSRPPSPRRRREERPWPASTRLAPCSTTRRT